MTYPKNLKLKLLPFLNQHVNSKVKEIAEQMKTDVQTNYGKDIAKASKEELTEKVDGHLSYVVEEWMKENEIALERALKEIAEDFITSLKKLFCCITLMFQMKSTMYLKTCLLK